MFVAQPNLEQLRQGDVVRGLCYPYMKCEGLEVVTTLNGLPDQDHNYNLVPNYRLRKYGKPLMQALVGVSCDFSVIISQCCDLELRQGQSLPSAPAFVIAPIFRVPNDIAIDAHKLVTFRNNGPDYANVFSLAVVPPLTEEHAMVDFGRLVSVPNTDYPRALQGKVLQMTDSDRVKFKTKLGLHFGRPTNEELAAGLFESSPQ